MLGSCSGEKPNMPVSQGSPSPSGRHGPQLTSEPGKCRANFPMGLEHICSASPPACQPFWVYAKPSCRIGCTVQPPQRHLSALLHLSNFQVTQEHIGSPRVAKTSTWATDILDCSTRVWSQDLWRKLEWERSLLPQSTERDKTCRFLTRSGSKACLLPQSWSTECVAYLCRSFCRKGPRGPVHLTT